MPKCLRHLFWWGSPNTRSKHVPRTDLKNTQRQRAGVPLATYTLLSMKGEECREQREYWVSLLIATNTETCVNVRFSILYLLDYMLRFPLLTNTVRKRWEKFSQKSSTLFTLSVNLSIVPLAASNSLTLSRVEAVSFTGRLPIRPWISILNLIFPQNNILTPRICDSSYS